MNIVAGLRLENPGLGSTTFCSDSASGMGQNDRDATNDMSSHELQIDTEGAYEVLQLIKTPSPRGVGRGTYIREDKVSQSLAEGVGRPERGR